MALYGAFLLTLPQIIGFVASLAIIVLMINAWQRTRNQGFLWLAVVTGLGQLHYLALRFGYNVFGTLGIGTSMAFHTWLIALLSVGSLIGWVLVNKQLKAKSVQPPPP